MLRILWSLLLVASLVLAGAASASHHGGGVDAAQDHHAATAPDCCDAPGGGMGPCLFDAASTALAWSIPSADPGMLQSHMPAHARALPRAGVPTGPPKA